MKHFLEITPQELQETFISYLSNKQLNAKTDPTELSLTTNFIAEQLHDLMAVFIDESPLLSKKTAVFPIFNLSELQTCVIDMSTNKLLADPRFQDLVRDKSPQEDRSTLEKQLGLDRNAEQKLKALDEAIKKGDQQDKDAKTEALRILEENNITKDTLFSHFLESIYSCETLVHANFNACNQFYIPFGDSGTHYTFALIHCETQDDIPKAHIHYRDPLGNNLSPHHQESIKHFFEKRGYTVDYHYSKIRKQKKGDPHNCAPFTLLEGIDLGNKNMGSKESFLSQLNDNNYHSFFTVCRYSLAQSLIKIGYQVKLTNALRMAYDKIRPPIPSETAQPVNTQPKKQPIPKKTPSKTKKPVPIETELDPNPIAWLISIILMIPIKLIRILFGTPVQQPIPAQTQPAGRPVPTTMPAVSNTVNPPIIENKIEVTENRLDEENKNKGSLKI